MYMTEDPIVSQPITAKPSHYRVIISLLSWFIPLGIVNAIFTGLAASKFCLMCFSSGDPWEGPFILMGFLSNVACLIIIPTIAINKINKKGLARSKALYVFIGLFLVFGVTIFGPVLSDYVEEGLNSARNMVWSATLKKPSPESLQFLVTKAEVILVNSNYHRIDIKGQFVGVENLSKGRYAASVSGVAYGPKGSETRLPLTQLYFYDEKDTDGLSSQMTISAKAPAGLVEFIKQNPDTPYKIVLTLSALSKIDGEDVAIWSKELEARQSYIPNMLQTFAPNLFVEMPQEAIKFSSINKQDQFVTEPDRNWEFTITTNPKQTLCCEASVLRTNVEMTKYKTLDEYLDNLEWKDEITSKTISPFGASQVAVIEANNTIVSPYRAIFMKQLSEVYSVLIDKDSGLDDLFQVYLDYYQPQTSNE